MDRSVFVAVTVAVVVVVALSWVGLRDVRRGNCARHRAAAAPTRPVWPADGPAGQLRPERPDWATGLVGPPLAGPDAGSTLGQELLYDTTGTPPRADPAPGAGAWVQMGRRMVHRGCLVARRDGVPPCGRCAPVLVGSAGSAVWGGL